MRQPEVFNNDIPVGLLTEIDKQHYEFQYYDDYLNSLSTAISFNLPKRKKNIPANIYSHCFITCCQKLPIRNASV